MNTRRLSVLQKRSGAQTWISQSHRDLVWLHFLPPPAGSPCSGARLRRLRWLTGLASEDSHGDASTPSPVGSRFGGRLTSAWLTFETKTGVPTDKSSDRQEFPVFWRMSQPAGGEKKKEKKIVMMRYPTLWLLLRSFSRNYFSCCVCLRKKRKKTTGWVKVRGIFAVFAYVRDEGYPDRKEPFK